MGIPAIGIMTDRFVSAADEMRRVLGAPDHPFAVIEHPISSASDAQLERQAEAALDQGLGILLHARALPPMPR